MVTSVRYYPRGYIGSEGALLRIAKTRHPERWQQLHEKEAEIYSGLGTRYNAEVLGAILRQEIPRDALKADVAIAERLFDFEDAARDLRAALHAGDLAAEFVDERGEFGWIKSAGWGGDEGIWILFRGVVTLEDGWVRLILFKIDAIDRFAVAAAPSSAKQERPKLSVREAKQKFKEWRESRGEDTPTQNEDFEYMRRLGVSRDRVKLLRKEYPSLPRGKPKAKWTAK